jgi:malonate-semialdehyde dehydrogenase (acetylating)/methylmalonate-semialdehyde dehydrogenase
VSTVQLETIPHRIGGAASTGDSSRTTPVYDPATGREQRQVLLADPTDVDAAVQAAKGAFAKWRDVSVTRRARVKF